MNAPPITWPGGRPRIHNTRPSERFDTRLTQLSSKLFEYKQKMIPPTGALAWAFHRLPTESQNHHCREIRNNKLPMLEWQFSYPCKNPQTSERPNQVSQQGGYNRWAFTIVVKHREALCIPLDNGNGTPKNHCLLCIDQLNKICLSFLWWSILLCSSFLAQQ